MKLNYLDLTLPLEKQTCSVPESDYAKLFVMSASLLAFIGLVTDESNVDLVIEETNLFISDTAFYMSEGMTVRNAKPKDLKVKMLDCYEAFLDRHEETLLDRKGHGETVAFCAKGLFILAHDAAVDLITGRSAN